MPTDFSVFRDRVAEACLACQVSEPKLAASLGLSPRRAIAMSLSGAAALDLYQVSQIADVLDVSTDWLLGRSNVMDVMEMQEPVEPEPPKKKAARQRKAAG